MRFSRCRFLTVSAALPVAATSRAAETNRFFTTARRQDRWLLVTPQGEPFFSLGLNHIDPTALREPETVHIWRNKYGNSTERWLKEVVGPDLRDCGFNSRVDHHARQDRQ